jgi:hypothetical protein
MKAFPTFPPSDEGRFVQRRGFWGVVHQGEWIPYALPMGGGTFGTLSTLDTLAATQQSIAAYGEDRAWREVEAALAAHNTQMTQMLGLLVERTEDRQRRYGSAASKTMQVADQFGRPQAQKVTAGVTLGFPLFLFEDALQWTRKFTQANGSAQQLAAEFDAILDADRRQVMYEIKAALMGTGNYTFNDVLVDNVALAVKRLVNADSAAIPLGPNGESFDGATHTHYLFTAGVALAAADLSALVSTVLEHTNRGEIQVWINSAHGGRDGPRAGREQSAKPANWHVRRRGNLGQALDARRLPDRRRRRRRSGPARDAHPRRRGRAAAHLRGRQPSAARACLRARVRHRRL